MTTLRWNDVVASFRDGATLLWMGLQQLSTPSKWDFTAQFQRHAWCYMSLRIKDFRELSLWREACIKGVR